MKIPHKIIILFKAEAHELLPDGRCSGQPIESKKLILEINKDDADSAKKAISVLTSEVSKLCH